MYRPGGSCKGRVLHQGADLGFIKCVHSLSVQMMSNALNTAQLPGSMFGDISDVVGGRIHFLLGTLAVTGVRRRCAHSPPHAESYRGGNLGVSVAGYHRSPHFSFWW